ncbi:hypothetical protein ACFPIJ_56495 [Dactylosporangium cerinum]|uniref:Hedgehog/Intein (Hint) domain-containing protein n=1 Tax=Dactylosporangium cerinum TaxID=1434730 RepID=A0ABV9WEP4_9ACTN
MPSSDRSHTPATYRTGRPTTYRTSPFTIPPQGLFPRRSVAAPCSAWPADAVPDGDLVDDRQLQRPATVRHVDSDCLIGMRDVRRGDLVQARAVDHGGHPRTMLPTLRRIWAATGQDSTRLTARLLAHDWLYLDATVTARHHPAGQTTSGRQAIAGVGVPRTSIPSSDAGGDPITVVPLAHLAVLDAGWLYLLDPAADTVTVHTGDGDLVSRHPLHH